MKKLINLSYHPSVMAWFDDDFRNVEKFLVKNDLDGVEILVSPEMDMERVPRELVGGVHLHYDPSWVDCYTNHEQNLLTQCGSLENIRAFFGEGGLARSKARYEQEISLCEKWGADYAVFHVSDVGLDEVFLEKPFRRTDEEVMAYAAKWINSIFGEETSFLLAFENLWWPGLTFRDYGETKCFFAQVLPRKKGFVLDIGHIMANIGGLKTEKEAAAAICARLDGLKELRDEIKVMHLNSALSADYLSRSHRKEYEDFMGETDIWQRLGKARSSVLNIDLHVPFTDPSIKDVLKKAQVDHLVMEFLAPSLAQFETYIKMQKEVLDI